MRQIICDECKVIVKGQSYKLTLSIKEVKIDNTPYVPMYFHTADLCASCGQTISSHFTTMFKNHHGPNSD